VALTITALVTFLTVQREVNTCVLLLRRWPGARRLLLLRRRRWATAAAAVRAAAAAAAAACGAARVLLRKTRTGAFSSLCNVGNRYTGLVERMTPLRARFATRDEILRFHTEEYHDRILGESQRRGGEAGHVAAFGPGEFTSRLVVFLLLPFFLFLIILFFFGRRV
jgi:hypothetical protein